MNQNQLTLQIEVTELFRFGKEGKKSAFFDTTSNGCTTTLTTTSIGCTTGRK